MKITKTEIAAAAISGCIPAVMLCFVYSTYFINRWMLLLLAWGDYYPCLKQPKLLMMF